MSNHFDFKKAIRENQSKAKKVALKRAANIKVLANEIYKYFIIEFEKAEKEVSNGATEYTGRVSFKKVFRDLESKGLVSEDGLFDKPSVHGTYQDILNEIKKQLPQDYRQYVDFFPGGVFAVVIAPISEEADSDEEDSFDSEADEEEQCESMARFYEDYTEEDDTEEDD